MMFALAITHIKILPKYGVILQSVSSEKSNLGTSGKLHALLSNIIVLHLHRHRVQKSIFYFFIKKCIFHIFQNENFKSGFLQWKRLTFESFSRNNQQCFIILKGFIHKIDQKLHNYTEIPLNWSLNCFVEYICMKSSHFVGMHQNNFDSGRQNERTKNL